MFEVTNVCKEVKNLKNMVYELVKILKCSCSVLIIG